MPATLTNPDLVTTPTPPERDVRAVLLVVAAVVGWTMVVVLVLLGFLLARAAG